MFNVQLLFDWSLILSVTVLDFDILRLVITENGFESKNLSSSFLFTLTKKKCDENKQEFEKVSKF